VRARTFTGHAADTDIIVASARSYLSALNKIIDYAKSKELRRALSGPADAKAAAAVK
jgi:hypothetical protein